MSLYSTPDSIKNLHLKVWREIKDYIFITFGLASYALGWAAFLIPYQITQGGVTGIGAIVYYATGVPMQMTYLGINAVLMIMALRFLGIKFCIKTGYGILSLTFLLWLFQELINPKNQLLGPGQDFMACVMGAALCGIGLSIVFLNNGSMGGTDIIAATVNKYRNVTLGRALLYCDIIIISSCYFVFYDWRRVLFGYVAMMVSSFVLDYIVNKQQQSVQFLIFSNKYEEIADRITRKMHRGVTVLDGQGWYSKQPMKVLCVLAKLRESVSILRTIRDIDENAFISQCNVHGVFGKGFDTIKIKKSRKDVEKPPQEA